jgi:hypothetical protein
VGGGAGTRRGATTFASGYSGAARRRQQVTREIGVVAVWLVQAIGLTWGVALVGAGAAYLLRQLDLPDARAWLSASEIAPVLGTGDVLTTGSGAASLRVDLLGTELLATGTGIVVFAGLVAGLVLPRWMRFIGPLPALGLVVIAPIVTRHSYSTGPAGYAEGITVVVGAVLAPVVAAGWTRSVAGTHQYPPMLRGLAGGGATAALTLLAAVGLMVGFDLTDGPFRHAEIATHLGQVGGQLATVVAAGALGGTFAAGIFGALVIALRRRNAPRGEISPPPGTTRRLAIAYGCLLVVMLAGAVSFDVLGAHHRAPVGPVVAVP